MTDALIGHTGFIGSNLLRQHAFDDCFDAANIEQIRGRGFDLIVIAGPRGGRAMAEAEPERDLDDVERLIRALSGAEARKVVLISTIDVFLVPTGVDEDSPTPMDGLHPYGRHRRRLEELVSARFDAHVLRLPVPFGEGLTNNIVYDLLNDDLEGNDARAMFQCYALGRLWGDIGVVIDNELPLVHLVTEPVSVTELARAALGIDFQHESAERPVHYDVRTLFANYLGGQGKYIEDKARALQEVAAFVAASRPK